MFMPVWAYTLFDIHPIESVLMPMELRSPAEFGEYLLEVRVVPEGVEPEVQGMNRQLLKVRVGP
jgi:hypothetical protein